MGVDGSRGGGDLAEGGDVFGGGDVSGGLTWWGVGMW